MAPFFFQLQTFLTYWLDAVEEHSLHSPFFYDLYTQVIKPSKKPDQTIERLRSVLRADAQMIDLKDPGAGSRSLSQTSRRVKEIARTSVSPWKYSVLYASLIRHLKSKTILELGTSLGINTLYLSQDPSSRIITFEGVPAIAAIARTTFNALSRKNITLIEGNIDDTLPYEIERLSTVDLAFIDANHRYEPTIRYFNCLVKKTGPDTVIIMDDIHYSAEMEKAWRELREHELVYGTIDLFRCGMLFFNPSLNKQHAVLQY